MGAGEPFKKRCPVICACDKIGNHASLFFFLLASKVDAV